MVLRFSKTNPPHQFEVEQYLWAVAADNKITFSLDRATLRCARMNIAIIVRNPLLVTFVDCQQCGAFMPLLTADLVCEKYFG
jgi:hypothetical protein